MTKLTRLLSPEEHEAMNEEAIAAGMYRDDRRVFTPGMAWYQPWYFDPTGERERLGKHVMITEEHRGWPFLSEFYWRDWSRIRSPMVIVCPNGEQWEIDRKSRNGKGWEVSGEWPNLTITPSIIVAGYHGYLSNGKFGPDLEGRGPNGIVLRPT